MDPIRVLHLSDLHARSDDSGADPLRLVQAMLADAKGFHERHPITLAIVTGDLSYSGKADEFARAHDLLLAPLQDAFGLSAERIVIVPGNHDVDRNRIDPIYEDGLLTHLANRARLNAVLDTPDQLKAATARLSAFKEFHSSFYGDAPPESAGPLAYVHRFDHEGRTVGVAALNSAWRCSGVADRGHLLIGDRQLEPTLDAIADCDIRIGALHHPTPWLVSWDDEAARTQFERHGLIVLSGHEHVSDPSAETTMRGYAIYGRAGCLYEARDAVNAYSLVDVEPDDGTVAITLRSWQAGTFGPLMAPNLNSGRIEFTLRAPRPLPAWQPSPALLQGSIAELAQQTSVLVDQDPDLTVRTVDDVLVPPRFWSLPHDEMVATAAAKEEDLPRSLDPEALLTSRVLLINGEAESGVSSSLLWLLDRMFSTHRDLVPAPIMQATRFKATKLERFAQKAANGLGCSLPADQALPPCIIVLDDVPVADTKALAELAKYVAEHEEHVFLLGCHGDPSQLHAALTGHAVAHDTVYLGPFGRRQLRLLDSKLNGARSPELVDQVLQVVDEQGLPRTPFITVALLGLLAQQADPASLNTSGILDSYVARLLGRDEPDSPDDLGLYYRLREHLLGWFAESLEMEDVTALPRIDVEEKLIAYFRAKGLTSYSSTRILDKLIDIRILMEDANQHVGFRHPAVRDLFAAKATRDNNEFATFVLSAPLDHARIVMHIAGLERNNRDLLDKLLLATRAIEEEISTEVSVDMFDLITDRPGWSDDEPDIDRLKTALEKSSDPDDSFDEDERDEADDNLAVYRRRTVDEGHKLPPYLEEFGVAFRTLASVLKNSELIDDVGLKIDATKQVLHTWSLLSVVVAVREDQSPEIRERLEQYLSGSHKDEADATAIERLIELITVMLLVIIVQFELMTPQLQEPLRAVLEDEAFMADTAHALFATMTYCNLRAPNWIEHLRVLRERHKRHPIVARLTETYAMQVYLHFSLSRSEEAALLNLLADIYNVGGNPQVRTAALENFRKRRQLAKQRDLQLEAQVDALDADEVMPA